MGFNAKLFEIVLYADSFDFCSLPALLGSIPGLKHYAFCIHDQCTGKEDSKLKDHLHLALRMSDTRNSDNIAKWFQASPSQVEKCKGRWADMLAYLTHANAPDKHQYDPSAVVSNFDWQLEVSTAGPSRGDARLNELLDGIGSGEIREYNLYDHMTIQEWAKYKVRLRAGFEYRIRKMKGAGREMKCFYVHGESGTGKTTWAKEYPKRLGYSVFVSSGSNDILDGYEGQDCIILDDLRPSCLGLSDLLKMLDPHTASTVKSRYYNKVLECKLIIITTTLPMDTFFHNVFEHEAEPLKQLERRCGTVMRLTKRHIHTSIYQPKTGRYRELPPIPNTLLAQYRLEDLTEDEMAAMQAELIGVSVSELKLMRKIDTPDSKSAGAIYQNVLDSFGVSVSDDVPF